jgi:tetratricopeptide (TPR) repeat protein
VRATALVAQNLFDFSLEIPGVAVPFAVLMGILARDMRAIRVPAWTVRAAAAAAAIVAVAGAATYRAHTPERDAERVASASTADDAVALAREVLPWHPADWVPPAVVGGLLAGEFRCDEAEPWLLRAMERNPTAFAPHLGAGRCYAIRGKRALAKREYRLAFMLGDPEALAEARRVFPGKGELLEVAPDTPDGLVAAARVLADSPEEARVAWRRAWVSFSSVPALAGLAAVTLDLGERDEALALGRKLEALAPQSPRGYLVAARALNAKGDADAALQELELGAARMPGNAAVLSELGVHHLGARRFSQAKAVFERILAREGPEVARKKLLVARALEGQDRYAEALRAAFDARDAQPDAAAPLEAISRISAKAGRYDEAIQSLETASHKPGKTPEAYADWIDALKTARVTKTVVDMEREDKAATLRAADSAP